LIARAGKADGAHRGWPAHIEQLEQRLQLTTIDPGGTSILTQTFPSLALQGGDQVIVDINPAAAAGSQNDVVSVSGAAALNGVLTLRLSNAASLTRGQTFEIIHSDGQLISGAFTSIRGIDASGGLYDFVAIQSPQGLRIVATDLPSTSLTIIPSGNTSQAITKADQAVAFYAAGSSDGLDDSLTIPATVASYGQRLIGSVTLTEGGTVASPFLDMTVGTTGLIPGRLVVSKNVTTTSVDVFSAFGTAGLHIQSPGSGQPATASLTSFSVIGFALADQEQPASLTNGSGHIGPVSFSAFTLSVTNLTISSSNIAGTITLGADSAALAIGSDAATNDSRFKIELTQLSVSVNIDLTLNSGGVTANPGSGAFQITADTFTMELQDVFSITASGGITINSYDSSLPRSQTLVTIGTAELEIPKLHIRGGFAPAPGQMTPGLTVRGDGFTFGTLTVGLDTNDATTPPTLIDSQGYLNLGGGRIKAKNPALRLNNFAMAFNPDGSVASTTLGGFGFQADEVVFAPFSAGSNFSASATGLVLDLVFGNGSALNSAPTGVQLSVATVNIHLGFVSISGTNITLDTTATGSQYFLVVAGDLTATLDLHAFFQSFGGSGPNIAISGSAGGFAVRGDGSFEAFTASSPAPYNSTPFHVGLTVSSGQFADVLRGVADLPESLPDSPGSGGTLSLNVTWPDFNAAPSRFIMSLTGEIKGQIGGATGPNLDFIVTDLQIDSDKIKHGRFPVVGLTSVSGSVMGTIGGGSFNGTIVLGIVRFNNLGQVLDSSATPDQIYDSVIYVGARGGLTLSNGWGVQAQFAMSEHGFLNFYISSNMDIPLGTSGLSLTGLRGGVTFNATPLPAITDPADLRTSAFEAPKSLTNDEWEASVRQLVINQHGGTPGFLFELDQTSGQDWATLFNNGDDPGLYLPADLRTQFLNAGISITRRADVAQVVTLDPGAEWLLLNGSEIYDITDDSGHFSISQVNFALSGDLIDQLPTGTDTATAGSIMVGSDSLVQLFANRGRTLSSTAVVAVGDADGEWTVTDGNTEYILTSHGAMGSEQVLVTGGDPSFESAGDTYIRLDVGFSMSNTGGSTAWRLDADAIVQFSLGSAPETKIVLLGALSVGPAANPTMSVDTRLFIDLANPTSNVTILFLSDSRLAPPAGSGNADAPVPFFSLYGSAVFNFPNASNGNTLSITLSGSQTEGLADFNSAGLISSPIGDQHLRLGAPSAPGANDGSGSATITFSPNALKLRFDANLSADGLINASSLVFAAGDFTVELATVNVGTVGSVLLPKSLYGAAYLTADLSEIQPLAAVGVTGTLDLLIKINTTTSAKQAIIRARPPATGTVAIDIGPTSFGVYGVGDLSFSPPGLAQAIHQNITGSFGLEITSSGAKLAVYGSFPLPLPVVGNNLAVQASVLGVFIVGSFNGTPGFAGRLKVVASNSSSAVSRVFDLNAVLDLAINSTSADQTLVMPAGFASRLVADPSQIPQQLRDALSITSTGAGGALTFTVPGVAPGSDVGTLAAPYIVFSASGNLTLRNPSTGSSVIDLALTQFRIAIQPTEFDLAIAGTVDLGPIGNVSIAGGLVITETSAQHYDSAGFIVINAALGVTGQFTFASAKASLQFNTFDTSRTFNIPGLASPVSIDANTIRVYISAQLNLANAFVLTGTFTLVESPNGFSMGASATFDFFGVGFGISGTADLYTGSNPGLVASLQMTRSDGTPGISLGFPNIVEFTADEADAVINTRSGGVSKVAVTNASLLIMGVIRPFSASLEATFSSSVWALSGNITGSILDFASITGTFLFKSNGEFSFSISGGFQIGGDNLGCGGQASLSVSYLAGNDGVAGLTPADLSIVGSGGIEAYARVKILGHWVGASVGISFTVSYSDGELTIRPCVHIPVFGDACATFTIARFMVSAPVPVEDLLATPMSDGTLRLNVGAFASVRNVAKTETAETYTLEPVAGDPTAVKVTAFGKSKVFTGVTSITGDFGSDRDTLIVADGLIIPMTIHGGDGDDEFIVQGQVNAQLFGDGGNDYLELAGSLGSMDGGDGDDVLVWQALAPSTVGTAGGASAVGGTGNDTLIVRLTEQADSAKLTRGSGQVFVERLNSSSATFDRFTGTSGFETLQVQTGAGLDSLQVGDLSGSGFTTFSADLVLGLTETGQTNTTDPMTGAIISTPTYTADSLPNAATVLGTSGNDTFTLSTTADTNDLDNDNDTAERVISVAFTSRPTLLILNSRRSSGNTLTVNALAGNDTINASGINGVAANNMAALTLIGGADNDTIVGSDFNDTIDSGLGNDTVTGGLGTDTFIDAGGFDRLVETRDRDFTITNTTFIVGSLQASSVGGFADQYATVDEVENLNNIFEAATITGGAGTNTFVVGDVDGTASVPGNSSLNVGQRWSGSLSLDGAGGGDRYIVTILGGGGATVSITDSGTTGSDSIRVFGSDSASQQDRFTVAATMIINSAASPTDSITFNSAIEGGVTVNALGGNDRIDASADSGVGSRDLGLTLIGGTGNDTIIGSAYNDAIDSGLGDDTVTGGLGTDTYTDAGGYDTFIETRDRDITITNNSFIVGTLAAGSSAASGDQYASTDEVENLNSIFEVATITGGSSANTITVGDVNGLVSVPGNSSLNTGQLWTGTLTLDGAGGGDTYIVTMFGGAGSIVSIMDSGSAASGVDSLRVFGSDDAAHQDHFMVSALQVMNVSGFPTDRVDFTSSLEGPIAINALAGNDTLTITGVTTGRVLTSDGGLGTNTAAVNTAGDFGGALTLTRYQNITVAVGADLTGSITASGPGAIQSVGITGSLTAPAFIVADSIDAMTVGTSLAGTVTVAGALTSLTTGGDISGTVTETLTINTLTVGGSLAPTGVVRAVNANAALGNINTMDIGHDLCGTLVVSGTLGSLSLDNGSICSMAMFSVGNLNSLLIGPNHLAVGDDMAGDLIINGNLGLVRVAGGTPGRFVAQHIGMIQVFGGFGPVVLRVVENGIERRIEMGTDANPYPQPNPDNVAGPSYVNVQFVYESGTPGSPGSLANPQLTARLTPPGAPRGRTPVVGPVVPTRGSSTAGGADNELGLGAAGYDFSLIVYSDTAKFNLARLDSNGPTGIRNVAVEGDLLTTPSQQGSNFITPGVPVLPGTGGIRLPQDDLVGVAIRDFAPNNSIIVGSIQGAAFGQHMEEDGRLETGDDSNAEDAQELFPHGTRFVYATGTFRIPFGDLAYQHVGFFLVTDLHNGHLDDHGINLSVQSWTHANAAGTANIVTQSNVARGAAIARITTMAVFDDHGHQKNGVYTAISILGDGASIDAQLGVNSIDSAGPLGDIHLQGQPKTTVAITAPAIFGSVIAKGPSDLGSLVTSGVRTDPITGAASQIPADVGSVYVAWDNVTDPYISDGPHAPTLPSHPGPAHAPYLTTTEIHEDGPAGPTSVVIRGNLVSWFSTDKLTNSIIAVQGNVGAFATISGATGRLGGIDGNDLINSQFIVLGQVIGDVGFKKLTAGRIAVKGDVLGNFKLDGDNDAATRIVFGGKVGDATLGTAATFHDHNNGIIAAKGLIRFAHTVNQPGYLFNNTGTTPNPNTAAIDAIFAQLGVPLNFDVNPLDLAGLNFILQDLGNLTVQSGHLTGPI
jgi:hypothetical protein